MKVTSCIYMLDWATAFVSIQYKSNNWDPACVHKWWSSLLKDELMSCKACLCGGVHVHKSNKNVELNDHLLCKVHTMTAWERRLSNWKCYKTEVYKTWHNTFICWKSLLKVWPCRSFTVHSSHTHACFVALLSTRYLQEDNLYFVYQNQSLQCAVNNRVAKQSANLHRHKSFNVKRNLIHESNLISVTALPVHVDLSSCSEVCWYSFW